LPVILRSLPSAEISEYRLEGSSDKPR